MYTIDCLRTVYNVLFIIIYNVGNVCLSCLLKVSISFLQTLQVIKVDGSKVPAWLKINTSKNKFR